MLDNLYLSESTRPVRVFCSLPLLLLFSCNSLPAQTLKLPDRPLSAPTGSEFAQKIAALPLPERERQVFVEIQRGNVPAFLRQLSPVEIALAKHGRTNTATFFVTPDYLAVGSDTDYLLMPMTPGTAQALADALECSLPTPKMVDAIYAAARVKLSPAPMPPSPAMTTVGVFSNHNTTVTAQRNAAAGSHPPGELVAGHKKDVVICRSLARNPGKVAIYGWHNTNGTPIQPLYLGHSASWVDYSQCVRLVQQRLLCDGRAVTVTGILNDSAEADLLSYEGVVPQPRYANPFPPNRGKGVGR